MSANGIVEAPESNTSRLGVRRWLSRAVAVVYSLVMFEVVIMVSPFAFYFYAAYGPTLKWLNHSAATAWLTGFLLPHAVFTTSPFLEFLRWDLGRYAFGLGLLAFFVLAAQIYGSKLLRRRMVNSGVYRYVRHPQYLSLGLSAFGLFTMWPRANEDGRIQEVACWAHVRRRWYDLQQAHALPVASEALQRIAELYAIEQEIRGPSGGTKAGSAGAGQTSP